MQFEIISKTPVTRPARAIASRFPLKPLQFLTGVRRMSVGCQPDAAALTASNMPRGEIDKADPDVSRAPGEICSMAAGNFKNKVAGSGDGYMLSSASVIAETTTVYTLSQNLPLCVSLSFEATPVVMSLLPTCPQTGGS
jgi:hypothetical protein